MQRAVQGEHQGLQQGAQVCHSSVRDASAGWLRGSGAALIAVLPGIGIKLEIVQL